MLIIYQDLKGIQKASGKKDERYSHCYFQPIDIFLYMTINILQSMVCYSILRVYCSDFHTKLITENLPLVPANLKGFALENYFLPLIFISFYRFKVTDSKVGLICKKLWLQTFCFNLETTCCAYSLKMFDFIDYLNLYSYNSFIL